MAGPPCLIINRLNTTTSFTCGGEKGFSPKHPFDILFNGYQPKIVSKGCFTCLRSPKTIVA